MLEGILCIVQIEGAVEERYSKTKNHLLETKKMW